MRSFILAIRTNFAKRGVKVSIDQIFFMGIDKPTPVKTNLLTRNSSGLNEETGFAQMLNLLYIVQAVDTTGRHSDQGAGQHFAVEAEQAVSDLSAKVPPPDENTVLPVKPLSFLSEKAGEIGIRDAGLHLPDGSPETQQAAKTNMTHAGKEYPVKNLDQIATPGFKKPLPAGLTNPYLFKQTEATEAKNSGFSTKYNILSGLVEAPLKFSKGNIPVESKVKPAMPVFDQPLYGKAAAQRFEAAQVMMDFTNNTANVTSTVTGETIPTSRLAEHGIITQLAEAMRGQILKTSDGQTTVRLRLQPEHLGELMIRLVYKDGHISTQIQTVTEHVKQMIENSLPQLRGTLAGFQLNLQDVSVFVGDESGRWGQKWNQERQPKHQKQYGAAISGSGANHAGAVSNTNTKVPLPGGMSRLNYFV